jgi:competence protein ComEA
MNPLLRSLRDWFGYTRRERRSSFILMLIMVFVIGLKYSFPQKKLNLEEIYFNEEPAVSTAVSENIPDKTEYQNDTKQEKQVRNYRRTAPLELNTCDSASLVVLPGIGPVLSARIIKYRRLIGGYVKVSQLKEVYGLPEETYNMISSRLMADPALVRKIKVNSADFAALSRHPYFKRNEVSAIMKFRELKGSIVGIDEMLENNLISVETAEKIRDYLEF